MADAMVLMTLFSTLLFPQLFLNFPFFFVLRNLLLSSHVFRSKIWVKLIGCSGAPHFLPDAPTNWVCHGTSFSGTCHGTSFFGLVTAPHFWGFATVPHFSGTMIVTVPHFSGWGVVTVPHFLGLVFSPHFSCSAADP